MLIYEIARPGCPFMEVDRLTFNDPPQLKGSPPVKYAKRVLIEATPEQIAEAESVEDQA